MRAVRFHRTGGPEVLVVDDVPTPTPGPGQVLVRHTAIGVNMIDTYHRSGLYAVPSLPSPLGGEAAGVVEALGDGVTSVRVGQRVAYAPNPMGAYAEANLVPADRLLVLPEGIADDVAAAGLLKGLTVEYLIRRTYTVKAGQTVLVHAAAGGVGQLACQWLRALGATVLGTVGSDAKAEIARAAGCHHTIVYGREDFVARVRELTQGRGVPVVYDSVGRTTVEGSLSCLEPRGLLVSFGNASGKPGPIDLLTLSAKGSLYVTRPNLANYVARRDELEAGADALWSMILAGKVRVAIGRRARLDEAAAVHADLEARRTTGSTILVP